MQKIFVTIFAAALMIMPAQAATWVAADRVAAVGKTIITKNNLPAKTTFKVVNGAADNTNTSTTNIVQISSTDLTYADPIVAERNSNKKKLDKFNKEQAKNKALRAKNIAQYKATGGLSGWDASYTILKTLTESSEK